jgi:tRNA pseudouridine55 synthase
VNDLEGIINIDKPKGISSFDVIRELRKTLKTRKIGHTGTLDPLATGVLVVCVGKTTKLASEIEAGVKEYRVELQLGYRTDTYDTEGQVLERVEDVYVDKEMILEKLEKFKGDILQVPPMYSALKLNGKKLYELARNGIEVEREARRVYVDELNLEGIDGRNLILFCRVSKGTYIRSLVDDLGRELGTFATMTSLRRVRVGEYRVEAAYTLEEIKTMYDAGNTTFLKGVEESFNYKKIVLENERQLKLFKNGNTVVISGGDGRCRVYKDSKFIGLGELNKNRLKGWKYF